MEHAKSDSKRVAAVMTCPFCQEMVEGEYAMMLVRPSAFIKPACQSTLDFALQSPQGSLSTFHRLASLMETRSGRRT